MAQTKLTNEQLDRLYDYWKGKPQWTGAPNVEIAASMASAGVRLKPDPRNVRDYQVFDPDYLKVIQDKLNEDGNTPEAVEAQIKWLESLVAEAEDA